MYNRDLQKQILSKKKRIVPVYSLNRDKVLIKNLKTSIVQDGNYLDRMTALNLIGKSCDYTDRFPVIYVDMGIKNEKEEKPKIPDREVNSEGFRFGDRAFFFGNEIFTEDAIDNKLRSYMYDERIRTQKELFDVYKIVKSQCPTIKYTKVNISDYKGLNLFFDISYYNRLFIENNTKMGEQGLKLYSETLRRFLNNSSNISFIKWFS